MDQNPYESPSESAALPRKKQTWKAMWGRVFVVSAPTALVSWLIWSLISQWRRTPDEWLAAESPFFLVNMLALLMAAISGYAWSAIDYHFPSSRVASDQSEKADNAERVRGWRG